jgi:glutathione-independent formaldehyde dehydrogenase
MQGMRAVVYNGPKDVSVNEVPDAAIEAPTDVIVRITATNICGSDSTCMRAERVWSRER